MRNIVFVASLSNPGGTELSLIRLLNYLPVGCFDITLLLLHSSSELEKKIPTWVRIRHVEPYAYKQYLVNAIASKGLSGTIEAGYHMLMKKYLDVFRQEKDERYFRHFVKRYEKTEDRFDVAISWALPKSIENSYVAYQMCSDKKVMWIHLDTMWNDLCKGSDVLLKKYDSIVCVSKSCRNSFIQRHPESMSKSCVMYNVLDAKEIKRKSAAVVSDMPRAGLLLVTCGRLSKEKNPEYSIEIANELIREGITDFKWIFVGGDENIGDHFSQLIKAHHLEDHLILMGFKDNPYPYVKQADLYVQLSMHESYCMALAEAQILGIPTVTTNFPSAYEIVEDGKTGLIVQQSPEDVCEGIEGLLRHPALLREMSANLMQRELSSVGHVDDFIRFIDTL